MLEKLLNKYFISTGFLFFILMFVSPEAYASLHLSPVSGTAFNGSTGTSFTPQTWSTTGGGATVTGWASSYPAGLYGLTFNAATATLSGTPSSTVTNYSFTVTAYTTGGNLVGTYTLTITSGGCSFVGGITNGSILFSNSGNNIDPSMSGTIVGTVTQQVQFTCQSGLAYTISTNPASLTNLTLSSSSASMSYSLGAVAAGSYTGTGSPVNVFIPSGSVGNSQLLSNFQVLPAGTYSNTGAVQVIVTWGTNQIVTALPIGSVTANIINTCVASPAAGAMTISIDPSSASSKQPFTVSQDATAQCTTGDTIVNIQARSLNGVGNTTCDGPAPGNGISGMVLKSASGKTIPYTFICNNSITGAGFGSGLGQPLGIGGFVAQPDAQTADYDNGNQYSDTVTLTIAY